MLNIVIKLGLIRLVLPNYQFRFDLWGGSFGE